MIQKDQTASGDNAVFDVKSNTVVMTGNVVVTQGQTVMRGERMVSNLTTGVTNVYSDSGCRLEQRLATAPKGPTPRRSADAAGRREGREGDAGACTACACRRTGASAVLREGGAERADAPQLSGLRAAFAVRLSFALNRAKNCSSSTLCVA